MHKKSEAITRRKAAWSERASNGAKSQTMKAVRIHQHGGPEVLRYEEVRRPKPKPGEVPESGGY